MKSTPIETEVRAVIEARAQSIRGKNAAGVSNCFSPNPVAYTLAPPLQETGHLEDGLEEWFATFEGPIGLEIQNLEISASDEVAFCHGLTHLTGKKVDGEKPDVWFRETVCLRKIDGRWLITHSHESVPFYMDGSFRAAVDLKPWPGR